MTALAEPTTARHPSGPRTVLVSDDRGLWLVPLRRRDILLALLRAGSLDRELAAGRPAETSRLLATRAVLLTSRRSRDVLARRFDELLARAVRPWRPTDPRVPIARSVLHGARDQITGLTDMLRSHEPVSAAGLAAARLLLTDGRSPVYALSRGDVDAVAASVRTVLAAL